MYKADVTEPPSEREVDRESETVGACGAKLKHLFLKKSVLFCARTLLQSPCGDSVRSLATVALAPYLIGGSLGVVQFFTSLFLNEVCQ